MRLTQIEAWALKVADDITHGRPVEDARVEIKSKWPEELNGVARRIAGHANAAGGEPILWLIGLDEKAGSVVGADQNEMATWYPKVQEEFDELAPSVIDLNVPSEGKTIVALFFDTSRAPFTVKNPVFGSPNCGPVSREVPWREGTSVRSAKRADLIRLLTPLEQIPEIEILQAELKANIYSKSELNWHLSMRLYFVSNSEKDIFIPFHRCEISVDLPDERRRFQLGQPYLEPYPPAVVDVVGRTTVQGTGTEVIIRKAGMVTLSAFSKSPIVGNNIGDLAVVRVQLTQAHDPRPILLTQSLPSHESEHGEWGLWRLP